VRPSDVVYRPEGERRVSSRPTASTPPSGTGALGPAARLRSVDALELIEGRLPALTGASRRVAEAIARDPWAVLGMTIYELAEASGVSLPSVTRFCRAVGYPGYRELLQALAQSLGRLDIKDLAPPEAEGEEPGLPGLVAAIVARQIEALQNTRRILDYEALERAIALVAAGERVYVVGSGGAYVSAIGTAVKLNWAGVPAVATTPDLFANQLVAYADGDVVVAISHQGRTHDTIETLRLARSFGARTISISAIVHAPLAEVAEVALAVFSPARALHGTFTVAHTAELVVADILAAGVAARKWADCGGAPPRRAPVADWIEQHLRIGPATDGGRRRPRGPRGRGTRTED
jgi:RpiR family carbohydrate utilization transcriptional regulator